MKLKKTLAKIILPIFVAASVSLSGAGLALAKDKIKAPETKKTVQYEGFIELGGMGFTENGVREGHKSWTTTGIDITKGGEKLKWIFTGKLGGMFEPVDDDPELPQCLTHLSFGSNYELSTDKNITFFPYAKINYNRWLRNENPKYGDSFSKLSFISGDLGIGAKYKKFYAKLGGSLPFLVKTNSGDLSGNTGLNAIVGVEWKKLNLGLLYEQTSFDKAQLDRYGIRIGVKF